ncbi:MAG: NAD(P)-dependent oxidoreductase, partial [Bacilli bacterium]
MNTYKIAFLGTGVMGASMATHLLLAGHQLNVYNRTKSKAQPLIEKGANWCDTVSECVQDADVVMTMLGYPQDVESVYFSEQGILNSAKKGSILIDFTTSTPALAVLIEEAAKIKSLHALDIPVSGGDVGARNATLALMIGGEKEVVDQVYPLLESIGKTITHFGGPGTGQHAKMCNQIAIAGTMLGVSEAMAYAKAAGLSGEQVIATLSTGAAGSWTLSNLAPRMLKNDFAPGFYVKHFIKDMGIAIQESDQLGLDLSGLQLA